jgi:DNA-binding NtrC family response regulator
MVRIAVIDDSPECGEVIADAAALRGWEANALTRVDDLLSRLRQAPADVIILDIWLGGRVSGWDLLEAFEGDPLLGSIPVIICSAAASELEAKRAWMAAHGMMSLDKPFDIDDLYSAVESALCRVGQVQGPRERPATFNGA